MRSVSLPSALLLTALAVFLTGCSRNPASPDNARLAPTGAGTLGGILTDDPPSPDHGRPGATASIHLAAGEAGLVKAGRFSVFIQKNSLRVPATISLWVASPEAMQVEMEVLPAAANDFQVSPQVTADLNDIPLSVMPDYAMYYWNTRWEGNENCEVNCSAHTITAPLKALTMCKVSPKSRSGSSLPE